MSRKPLASITSHFANVSDARVERSKRHELLAIITIAICAVLCGADTWVAVEQFGHDKFEWLQTFLALPHPSQLKLLPSLKRVERVVFLVSCAIV